MASDGQSALARFGQGFVAGGWTMYPVLLLLIIVGAFIAPRFLSFINIINILEQVSVLGLTTIGLTFVLLIGRLDLSLEGVVGFAPFIARAKNQETLRFPKSQRAAMVGRNQLVRLAPILCLAFHVG